jgi:type I restriction enzyme S subunit
MTAFPKYPAYKDSGAAWLGEVPEHWSTSKSKWLWSEIIDPSADGSEELLSISQYTGVTPTSETSRSESLEGYRKCQPGDLAMNIMLAWQGGLGISEHHGIISPAYSVFRLKSEDNSRYLGFLYRTKLYLDEFARRSTGIVPSRWRLYPDKFGQVLTLLPPRAEQDRIVAFLDEKTAQIDALIAKKQRQIELLDEQKSILINRAVTRGLHPNPDLQDSGIPWIGSIPKGWEVKRFRYCAHIRGGQVDPRREPYRSMTLIAPDHIESGTGQILGLQSAQEQSADSGKYQVQAGDLIYSKIRPNLRKACIAPTDCLCSADMYAVVPSKALEPSFLLNYMLSEGFTKAAVDVAMRVAMPKVNRESLADFPIVIPLPVEQSKIVAHLTELENARLKAAKSLESQIQTLQTLRSTLIAHAVTGKIKVP